MLCVGPAAHRRPSFSQSRQRRVQLRHPTFPAAATHLVGRAQQRSCAAEEGLRDRGREGRRAATGQPWGMLRCSAACCLRHSPA